MTSEGRREPDPLAANDVNGIERQKSCGKEAGNSVVAEGPQTEGEKDGRGAEKCGHDGGHDESISAECLGNDDDVREERGVFEERTGQVFGGRGIEFRRERERQGMIGVGILLELQAHTMIDVFIKGFAFAAFERLEGENEVSDGEKKGEREENLFGE